MMHENSSRGSACLCYTGPLTPETVGALADLCELFSIAFSFPTVPLSEALASGSFQADLNACLDEIGSSSKKEIATGQNPSELYANMRREYSRLYHSPGKLAVIYPYESAFLFKAKGGEGFPSLFVNPVAIDVERLMREGGALPENSHSELVDSIFSELDFLRLLYTNALVCMRSTSTNAEGTSQQWLDLAQEFHFKHINSWVVAFMRATKEETRSDVYRQLADAGVSVFTALAG